MAQDRRTTGKPVVKSTGQADDNIDDLGRDVNRPERNIGDRATVEQTGEAEQPRDKLPKE